jgi:hypothetical protein
LPPLQLVQQKALQPKNRVRLLFSPLLLSLSKKDWPIAFAVELLFLLFRKTKNFTVRDDAGQRFLVFRSTKTELAGRGN